MAKVKVLEGQRETDLGTIKGSSVIRMVLSWGYLSVQYFTVQKRYPRLGLCVWKPHKHVFPILVIHEWPCSVRSTRTKMSRGQNTFAGKHIHVYRSIGEELYIYINAAEVINTDTGCLVFVSGSRAVFYLPILRRRLK